MKGVDALTHEFLETFPKELEEGKLYISIKYHSAAHNCCCGCGKKVITPLSPVGWTLSFDGKTVSLDPSIGSWTLPCKSHYFITKNKVEWAKKWSEEKIERVRLADFQDRQNYYTKKEEESSNKAKIRNQKELKRKEKQGVLQKLKNLIKRK